MSVLMTECCWSMVRGNATPDLVKGLIRVYGKSQVLQTVTVCTQVINAEKVRIFREMVKDPATVTTEDIASRLCASLNIPEDVALRMARKMRDGAQSDIARSNKTRI